MEPNSNKIVNLKTSILFSFVSAILAMFSPHFRMLFSTLAVNSNIPPILFADASKIRIDPMTHTIGIVTQSTFDGKVSRFRSDQVFLIFFYSQKKACPDCKKLIDGEYNDFSKKMQGIVNVLATDCDESPKLCNNLNISSFPSVMVYPTLPMPPFLFQDKINGENLSKVVRNLIPDNSHSIVDEATYTKFMNLNAQVPKVLFFSDKSKVAPVLVKAISNSFKDKIYIGYIFSKNVASVVEKFTVSSYPHVRVLRKGKKDEVYAGKFDYQPLFDWINVYSETFVLGGGFSDSKLDSNGEESRPWKFEAYPELTRFSNVDICFKKTSKSLCVIFIKDGSNEKDPEKGVSKLNEKETKLLEKVKAKYDKKLEGKELEFRYMWLDINFEKNFKDFFAVDPQPGLVVFNPYKKMRWTKIEGEVATFDSISKILDKIISGDARFKIVQAQKLPQFMERKIVEKSDAKKKDEL